MIQPNGLEIPGQVILTRSEMPPGLATATPWTTLTSAGKMNVTYAAPNPKTRAGKIVPRYVTYWDATSTSVIKTIRMTRPPFGVVIAMKKKIMCGAATDIHSRKSFRTYGPARMMMTMTTTSVCKLNVTFAALKRRGHMP